MNRQGEGRGGRRLTQAAVLLALLLFATGSAQLLAQTAHRTDPALNQQAQGLLAARCAVCHSLDLVQQQRLPRERWEATIDKMIHWGAQMDQAETALLVTYLSAYLHPEAGAVVDLPGAQLSGPGTGAATAGTGVAARGADLYRRNCLPCHGEAAQGGVGPHLARNPILTRNTQFYETVRSGRGAMPSWAAVLTQQDIADIHAWLKTL